MDNTIAGTGISQPKTQPKIRNMNADIMRTIAIAMVLMLHFVGSGGFFESANGANYILIHLIRSLCIVAVNIFFLVSGYFNIKSRFKLAKLLRIVLTSFIYSVVIGGIVLVLFKGRIDASFKDIVKMFVPVTADVTWFITAYIGVYILSPFVNKSIEKLDKQGSLSLIIVAFVMLCLINTIPTIHPFDKTNGYGLVWGLFMYIVGAYVRLYVSVRNQKAKKHMLIYLGTSLLIAAISICAACAWKRIGIGETFIQFFYTYNNALVFISSLSFFLYFVLKPESIVKNTNSIFAKCVTAVSTSTLGVYLIHQNIFLREVLWCDILRINTLSASYLLFAYMLLCCALILAVSVIIDKGLQKVLNMFFKSKLYIKFDESVYHIFGKIRDMIMKY